MITRYVFIASLVFGTAMVGMAVYAHPYLSDQLTCTDGYGQTTMDELERNGSPLNPAPKPGMFFVL